MIKKWWMESVGYQIYPKSFYDSDNDGHGDLEGIREKLPYLKELGIDLIWICPFYDSPMDDNGYDVSNYFDVYQKFGTLDDVKHLLTDAKKMGIRIILDLVLNHTSDEHHWFIESRKSTNNAYRDYYIWQKGKDGFRAPTNWGSFFGGSAWNFDEKTNEYYMKIFSDKMPDLNWKNHKVREAMMLVAKYWLDLGVDGFRIDAVSHLSKASFEDAKPTNQEVVLDWFKFSNLPEVHEYLKEMNHKVFSLYDALTVGEVGGEASIDSAKQYAGFESQELSMVFNFDHNWCNNLFDINDMNELKTNVKGLKQVFNKWQVAFQDKGWLPLNWLNHDQPRLMSQYGDQNHFNASGKMLCTAMYLMRGTPFIFQGEEIGMTNYPFKSVNEYNDISSIRRYNDLLKEGKYSVKEIMFIVNKDSRDNPRTAMQWDTSNYAGFSKTQPEVLINENYHQINVEESIKDKTSLWNHYKEVFSLRKESKYRNTLIYGKYEQIDLEHESLYIYKRYDEVYDIYVINSFSKSRETYEVKGFKKMKIILNNYTEIEHAEETIFLMPYQSIVLVYDKENL